MILLNELYFDIKNNLINKSIKDIIIFKQLNQLN